MNKAQKEVQQAHLDEEKHVIELLKKVYAQASKDCDAKIRELSTRTDFENLQSVIYQKQYQEALKTQLSSIMDNLQTEQYTTIDGYLQNCYKNGYTGAMYDIAKQGVPVVMPIRQDQVVKAVQTNSKLSEGLYKRLGEDTKYLKRSVRAELSRGIANGSSWNDMAQRIANGMKSPYNQAYNRAITIARTEGHRIQQESGIDACKEAKKKGADVVKQWDSTLDGRTRPEHREADGQIRELDEDFDVGGQKLKAPGVGGSAWNVCNCRCCMLQRARWALDEDELQTLKARAEYFGLDKSRDFDDFKEKYSKITEAENEEAERTIRPIVHSRDYAVRGNMIQSRTYVDKFNKMADDPDEIKAFYQAAKEILQHRSGQNGEDLYYYNTENKKWYKSTTGKYAGTPEYTEEILNALANSKKGTIVSFHNHPASMPPSIDDINAAFDNGYKIGYALCHDGKIYRYSGSDRRIPSAIYDLNIASYQEEGYTEFEAQLQTMKDLSKRYGFKFEEVI